MQILVPPSEGKYAPRSGRPVDPAALSFPELAAAREKMIDALVEASARPDALEVLGVGATLADEVAANTAVRMRPSAAASRIYTGVLYDALGWASLSTGARRRAGRRLIVISALWGALRFSDRIPAYRLSMDTTLPSVGQLARWWRDPLDAALRPAVAGQLVVDCRSTTYAAAWRPGADIAERTVTVRVFRETDGNRSVVSHLAKHTRGEVVRHLLERGARDPRSSSALAEAVGEAYRCELVPPARGGSAWSLDVILER